MKDWLLELCGGPFMPHGQCYLWNPSLIWLHVVSDSLIALAYYSIPLTLIYFVRVRRDVAYPAIFLLFAAFIVACGTTHVMEVWSIWHASYWLSGIVKALTAAISLVSAIALVRIVPRALELPSHKELRELNDRLETNVRERTADLTTANAQLRHEVAHREEAEAEVRRLNDALEYRVAELQALFEVLPVGVGICRDPECRDIRTNRAFATMLGISPDANASLSAPPQEAPSTYHIEIDGRTLSPEELPMQCAVRENRPVLQFEETIVRHDGTRVDVVVDALPLRDEHGRANGVVATFQDVTARKRAERERLQFERKLLETQKLESIGVLAGGIAHDFNNLLTPILGNAALVRERLPADQVQSQRQLLDVEKSAQRAGDLCKQLLAYAGHTPSVVVPLNLNRVIEDQVGLLKVSVSKLAELQFELDPALRLVRGDDAQLRQVLLNLVTNASEAIGERPGKIIVRTQLVRLRDTDLPTLSIRADLAPGWYVSLEVIDDGCGMDAAKLARIFDPFFTTKFIGRGLGLSVLVGIMNGHKGGIKVASTPGQGTQFQLLFPALPDSATPFPHESRAPAGAVHGRGTILVVDDESSVREFSRAALTRAGFDVELAHDGVEAVALVRATPARFAAVVLDLRMPRMDGEEALFVLRQISPKLPVILSSGIDEKVVHARFLERGLAGFLAKPFTPEILVNQVADAIRSARRIV